MRTILTVLLVMGLALAVGPVGLWETDADGVMYESPVDLYETANANSGVVAFTSTVNGAADTLFLWIDYSSATYGSCDMLWTFKATADATGDATEDMKISVWKTPIGDFASRTAGDTLTVMNNNSSGSFLGTLYYTVGASTAAKAAMNPWCTVVPGTNWTTPWYTYNASTVADSTGFMLMILASDSCEVMAEALLIPRV